jgi:hypothetical protein
MPNRFEDTQRTETETDTDDASDTRPRTHPDSWRNRHGLKVLGAVMIVMFASVITAQVGC